MFQYRGDKNAVKSGIEPDRHQKKAEKRDRRFDDWEKGRDGGQMSEAGSQTCPQRSRHARHREAQPRRTGFRGGRGPGDERTDGIDLRAERVTDVVKAEVVRSFERGKG